ncbi:MAG: hypothetical protein A3C15_01650 [Candidatus Magasanikbacteria bacterium RIFCSPHIGHO2_02_FULL_50_9b]|uniref:Uncharacterized protein n=1 Tax=Candidatus Magasanikbacteria bacterium RIFCSPHIGHO2_02_FULL_50_9b TaxID=1798682 RepID=A0A1F6M8T4_9BACT|nr:MAG: hypothetical protein A3C15_01650 [Candidatus Magasanikbacteria bacterium RIFCSPHIGHO2_02_FULL_50_9b]
MAIHLVMDKKRYLPVRSHLNENRAEDPESQRFLDREHSPGMKAFCIDLKSPVEWPPEVLAACLDHWEVLMLLEESQVPSPLPAGVYRGCRDAKFPSDKRGVSGYVLITLRGRDHASLLAAHEVFKRFDTRGDFYDDEVDVDANPESDATCDG